MTSRAAVIVLALACLSPWASRTAMAVDIGLEQVLVSGQGDRASVKLVFGCRYRYVDHSPLIRADRLQVNLRSVDQCGRFPVSTPRRETRRPVGRELAYLRELELIRSPDGSGVLLLHFEQPVTVTVSQRGDLSRLVVDVDLPTPAANPQPVAAATREGGIIDETASGLTAAQIDALMQTAQSSMLNGEYDRAIQIYTKVLREPEHAASSLAQEYLGLARERKGQTAHAVTEYRRYLMLYPDGEGAARVSQRLSGLTAVPSGKEMVVPRRVASRDSRWEFNGGLAQYYRRDASQYDGGDRVTSQSSVLTDVDLMARRRGERLDFSSRMTLGNLYDLLGEDEGPGNSTRIYYLYADLVDNSWDWSARIGRQSLHSSGVLGRFDGAELSWQWRPDLRLNLMSGFPVDSSQDGIETGRKFYGASVDLSDIFGTVDISLFYNTYFSDSIEERQAVGSELRYFDTERSLVTLIDYDISFSEINSFVMLGNWAFANRVTLNAMADFRKSPLLTTRNALIGQGETTLDELVVLFGEDEVRQLARDRTGELQTYSFGISVPIFDRFQLNSDLSSVDYTGTAESGGIGAVPDSGGSLYYSMTLIGTGMLLADDRSLIGFGYADGYGTKTLSATVDTRYRIGNRFQLNPRVRLSRRETDSTDLERWIAAPSLRTLYRFSRYFELELEVGGEWSSQKINSEKSDYNAYFIYAGYRSDF